MTRPPITPVDELLDDPNADSDPRDFEIDVTFLGGVWADDGSGRLPPLPDEPPEERRLPPLPDEPPPNRGRLPPLPDDDASPPDEDVRAAARRHKAAGRVTIAYASREKGPKGRGAEGWQKRRYTDADIAMLPLDANLGLLLGVASGGLVDVDLDCAEARALADVFLSPTGMRHGRPSAPESHRFYTGALPPLRTKRYKDPTAAKGDKKCLVELRSGSEVSASQTMIPPSIHPSGEKLAWVGGSVYGEPARIEIVALQTAVAQLAVASLLANHFPSVGQRHEFALALGGMLLRGGLSEHEAHRLVYEVARVGGSADATARAATVRSTARRIAVGEAVTGRTRLAEIIGDGGDRIVDSVAKWLELGDAGGPPFPAGSAPTAGPHDTPGTLGPSATAERPLSASYFNVLRVVRENLAGVLGERRLAFDEMRRAPTLDGRELRDVDVYALRASIEERIPVRGKAAWLKARVDDVHAALLQVASERSYHPVRDYLSGLVWDGTPRIELVASTILHAADTAISRMLLRRWFISAVARPMSPGCKMDTVLVLVGDQGWLKSTFFDTLAGEHFTDTAIDIHSKDSYEVLQRSWILEWSELESIRRRAMETVKAFLSSRRDTYRPSYGRLPVTVPRTSVIVGTTNRPDFLDDETGNRRFWLVDVGGEIDLPRLREWRDQLWAEAVAAYHDGEQWWLTPDEEAALAPVHEAHATTDPWTEIVLGWAAAPAYPEHPTDETPMPSGSPALTAANILRYAVKKPIDRCVKTDETRVTKILTRGGYEKAPRAGNLRVWRLRAGRR